MNKHENLKVNVLKLHLKWSSNYRTNIILSFNVLRFRTLLMEIVSNIFQIMYLGSEEFVIPFIYLLQ